VRFGIVGTGFVSGWFVDACRRAGAIPTGVYSRNPDRGRAFADTHGIPFVAADLGELAASGSIDAVYVASPIAAHAQHVATVLEHGKHVLCEKTLATSPDQVVELFELAARHDCVLLEAVRPTHDPAYELIKAELGRLGVIRGAHFEKCQYSSRYPAFLRGEVLSALDPSSGNSALRDIGVYCLHPCLNLFGVPSRFTGLGYRLSNGFEGGGTILLEYPSMSVTCTYSKTTRSVNPSIIQGEQGTLTIDSIAEPAQVVFTDVRGEQLALLSGRPKQPYQTLHHPIETLLRLCAEGTVEHRYRGLSLAAERIMSRILQSWAEAPTWHQGAVEKAVRSW
jgi:predicted dehydrogenase